MQFKRVIDCFEKSASVRPIVPAGCPSASEEDTQRVKNPKAHLREAAEVLEMSFGHIWNILRTKLKWKPYKPHLAQVLSADNMESRLAACTFWLTFTE